MHLSRSIATALAVLVGASLIAFLPAQPASAENLGWTEPDRPTVPLTLDCTPPAGPNVASATAAGVSADGVNYTPLLSADGSKVVFTNQDSTAFGTADTQQSEVFVKDRRTGAVAIASAGTGGWVPPPDHEVRGTTWAADVSATGRYVAMNTNRSFASNDTPFPNLTEDVYVKDMTTGVMRLVSTNNAGFRGNGSNSAARMSGDGRYVVFESSSTNLGDANPDRDIYVKDLQTGLIRLVSTNATGTKANGDSYGADISNDGKVVVFTSLATNLVAGASGAAGDVYIKRLDNNSISRAAALPSGGRVAPNTASLSIAGNGSAVAFYGWDIVDGAYTNYQLYVRKLSDGSIQRATQKADGSAFDRPWYSAGGRLSDDGRLVTIGVNATNLDPRDTDDLEDSYVKNLETGALELRSVAADGTKLPFTTYPEQVLNNGLLSFQLNAGFNADSAYITGGVCFTGAPPAQRGTLKIEIDAPGDAPQQFIVSGAVGGSVADGTPLQRTLIAGNHSFTVTSPSTSWIVDTVSCGGAVPSAGGTSNATITNLNTTTCVVKVSSSAPSPSALKYANLLFQLPGAAYGGLVVDSDAHYDCGSSTPISFDRSFTRTMYPPSSEQISNSLLAVPSFVENPWNPASPSFTVKSFALSGQPTWTLTGQAHDASHVTSFTPSFVKVTCRTYNDTDQRLWMGLPDAEHTYGFVTYLEITGAIQSTVNPVGGQPYQYSGTATFSFSDQFVGTSIDATTGAIGGTILVNSGSVRAFPTNVTSVTPMAGTPSGSLPATGGVVAAGATFSSPGPNAEWPVGADVTSPVEGAVSIAVSPYTSQSSSSGYSVAGVRMTISAPAGSATDPLEIRFRVPPGGAFTSGILRNGTPVNYCPANATSWPTACIVSWTETEVVIRTPQASVWTISDNAQLPPNPPVNVEAQATTEGVAVSWDHPNDGAASVTRYEVTESTSGQMLAADSDATSAVLPGLTSFGQISVTAVNEFGHSVPATVGELVVEDANTAPAVQDASATTKEDTSVTRQLVATDADGDALTYALASEPANGTVTISDSGEAKYTPNANFHGVDSFTFTADDGTATSAPATFTVTVSPVNDAPDAVNDAFVVKRNSSLTVPISAVLANDSDIDGDKLSLIWSTNPKNGTLKVNSNGTVTYTPKRSFTGTDTIVYMITDGKLIDFATVTITVIR